MLIRTLSTPDEMAQLEELQRTIWPDSETDVVPAHLLLTLANNGGIVLGAVEQERIVGFVFGFLGTDQESPNRVAMARLKHCSHQLGVHADHRGRGLAAQLKWAQREHVIRQGIRLVTWTYDPLMSINAHLNIRRLGAVCNTYKRDVYGDMRDGINRGVPSDRFQVDWWVTSNRVESRVDEARPPLDLANYLSAGARKVLSAGLGKDGLPRPSQAEKPSGNLALVEIPPDFLEIKVRDLVLAQEWRERTRAVFEGAFAAGYIVTDFVHLAGETFPRSYYVLSAGDSTLG